MRKIWLILAVVGVVALLGAAVPVIAEDEYDEGEGTYSEDYESASSEDYFQNQAEEVEDVSFDGGGGSTSNVEYEFGSSEDVPDVGPSGPVGYYDDQGNYYSY